MTSSKELYEQYKTKMQRIADVRNANAVLQWDQETYLPPKGAAFRGQQISTLSEIAHQLFSEDTLGAILQELAGRQDLSSTERRNFELTLEDYTKNKKYTSLFVRTMSEHINKAFHSWIEARKKDQFSIFQKDLEGLIHLKRKETELLGYEHHPYNALLNEYERGYTVELLDNTFTQLLPELSGLLSKILSKPQVDDSFLYQHFSKQQQWDWGMYLLEKLNFDFEGGRQDISEHPFSISFNKNDVRITTRIDEADFGNMTWSCIHEAGHALYEQGLAEEHYGLPHGEACSYSMHESQSRLWENNVGRGIAFWHYHYSGLQQFFPQQFGNIPIDHFYKGINKVQPSLIRTEADEITYHVHVYIRYKLEKGLIEGELSVADIPAYWNEQYKKLLNVTITNDKQGCLQDVHWSHGSFGYFPTYSLGSFYAAQFYTAAARELPDLEPEIEKGNHLLLLNWLRNHIHSRGRIKTSEELCKEVTGQSLDINHFLNYISKKYAAIYSL